MGVGARISGEGTGTDDGEKYKERGGVVGRVLGSCACAGGSGKERHGARLHHRGDACGRDQINLGLKRTCPEAVFSLWVFFIQHYAESEETRTKRKRRKPN